MADPDNTFKNHWQSIKKLKGKKRYEFIWEYFKIHLIMAAVGIFAAAWLLNHYIINPPPNTYINISFYSTQYIIGDLEEMANDLAVIIPDDLKKRNEITLDMYDLSSSTLMTRTVMQRFMGNIMLRDLDIIICDKDSAQSLINQGIALSCEVYLDEKRLETYSGKLFSSYIIDDEGNTGVVDNYGIIIDGSSYLEQFGFDTTDMMMIAASNSDRIGKAVEAIDIILAE